MGDPLGSPNHDAATLASAQDDTNTVEIRFFLESMHYDLFRKVMEILASKDVTLLSARLDERAFCQVNVCISGSNLNQSMEDSIMAELHQAATDLKVFGYMDKCNLLEPEKKDQRLIGSALIPSAPVKETPKLEI